jgi:hypothetical protein
LIIFDNLDSLKHSVYHPIKLTITHFVITATFIISFVQDLSSSVWSITDKMSIVEMKELIQNVLIVAIAVAHPHDKFLVCDGEGYTKLFQFTEKSFVFEEKYDLSSYKGILAADFSDTMNFWLIGFDNATVKWWSFDDLNGSSAFEFSTYPCVVTTIRACFDQDVFISADDYKIRLIDVLRNREKIFYYGHTNLIIDISVCGGCDRWSSLQYNGDIYV